MSAGGVSARSGRATVRIVVGLLIVLAVGTGWFLHAVINADGADVPPTEQMPALPAGAAASPVQQHCGSGGCWLEMLVGPPEGASLAVLAEQMRVAEERVLAPGSAQSAVNLRWFEPSGRRSPRVSALRLATVRLTPFVRAAGTAAGRVPKTTVAAPASRCGTVQPGLA